MSWNIGATQTDGYNIGASQKVTELYRAGAGAENRLSAVTNYTLWSLDAASFSGNCTKLAFYGNVAENDVVKFGFYSISGVVVTLETSVYEFTISAGEAGDSSHVWTSVDGDFTAFSVTSGWYLGCYSEGGQDYFSTGGNGFFYKAGDSSAGTDNASNDTPSPYIDALSADIVPAGGATTHALAGTIESGSDVEGVLSLVQSLLGTIESGSDVDGVFNLTQSLLGTIESGSDVEGVLSLVQSFIGSIESGSAIVGALDKIVNLEGTVQSASNIDGDITLTQSFKGTIESKSELTGDLDIKGTVSLAGSMQSGSSLDGSLSLTIKLLGSVESGSSLSGVLSISGEVVYYEILTQIAPITIVQSFYSPITINCSDTAAITLIESQESPITLIKTQSSKIT